VKVFNNYFNNINVNTNIMNFSVLSKEVIEEAKEILIDLAPIIDKLNKTKN